MNKTDKRLLLCLISILAAAMLIVMSGCSTTNGVGRDLRSIGEAVAGLSQKLADKQADASIDHNIREENRILRRGNAMAAVR